MEKGNTARLEIEAIGLDIAAEETPGEKRGEDDAMAVTGEENTIPRIVVQGGADSGFSSGCRPSATIVGDAPKATSKMSISSSR